jgi:predicted ribosome quality control (RQC) complex YloA/Tae2 family protein
MFDVLTVSALADELRETVLDGRIQRIGLVDRLTLAAEIYAHGRRRALVASADPQQPRLLLVDSMPSLDPNLITPFGLMLRKYVRGGFLIGIEQPPLERMMRLSIAKRANPHNVDEPELPEISEDSDDDDIWSGDGIQRVDLTVEIMGRHSNLILIDEAGLVMDSVKRVTTSMSRVRPIQPKRTYVMPPPVEKPDPRRITSASLETILAQALPKSTLSDLLVKSMRGVSPQIAREIAFRATGSTKTRAADVNAEIFPLLASTIRGHFEPMLTSAWKPFTYEREGEVFAFSATPLTYLAADPDVEAVARTSISAAAAAMEPVSADMPQSHAQRRAQLSAIINAEMTKVSSRLASLIQQHAKAEDVDELRTAGELIYAYLWQIQPGDSVLEVDGQTIRLDPTLSAKDNAAGYFDKYRRSQRAGEHLPARIENAEREIEYLQQIQVQVEQAEGFAALESLRAELYELDGSTEAEKSRTKQQKPKSDTGKRGPLWTDPDGNTVFVGRSGKENDHLTFTVAGPNDTWLHARGIPGSHVIVKWQRPQDDDPQDTIEAAAALAGWYSSARESGNIEVDVAKRRHVRKIKGAGPGMVTYRNERTILVKPRDESKL